MDNRERILKYGIEVFKGEIDKFSTWLLRTNTYLGDKTPHELLETEEGRLLVKNCLNRIDQGVFS